MKNHQSHKWSGWPGAFCLVCGISDPMEEDQDTFPYPEDIDHPTLEEEIAMANWHKTIDEATPMCSKALTGEKS